MGVQLFFDSIWDVVPYIAIVAVAYSFALIARSSGLSPHRGATQALGHAGAIMSLALFQGSRTVAVGSDTSSYLFSYDRIPTDLSAGYAITTHEPLFFLTGFLAKSAGFGDGAYLVLVSILAVVPAYAALLRFGGRIEIGVLFYCLFCFYLLGFNVSRQAIALGFIGLAYAATFVSSRMPRIESLFWIIIASGFHYSAAGAGLVILTWAIVPRAWRMVAVAASVVTAAVLAGSGQFSSRLLESEYGNYFSETYGGLGSAGLLAFFAFATLIVGTSDEGQEKPYLVFAFIGLAFLTIGLWYVFVARAAQYFLFSLLIPLTTRSSLVPPRVPGLMLMGGGLVFFVANILLFAQLAPYRSWLGP